MKHIVQFLLFSLFLAHAGWLQAQEDMEAGKASFKEKCASCHLVTKEKAVGPGLEGIAERRDKAWLHAWIKDSKAMIASGDSTAMAIFAEFDSTEMTAFPTMSDAEIDNILFYIANAKKAAAESDEEVVEIARDSLGRPISKAAKQVAEWTAHSEGSSGEVIVPMIILAVFLVVMWFASIKVPGYPE